MKALKKASSNKAQRLSFLSGLLMNCT
uniref:Uncharacterized protein n=1 Tax=Rhizophora mucronata TaxID=61149 RepID=A0A2P2N7H6_RHIMU